MSEQPFKTPEEKSEASEEPDSYDDFIEFDDKRALESSKQA